MADLRTRYANFIETRLSAELGPTDLILQVEDTATFPDEPYYITVNPNAAEGPREVMLVRGAKTATTLSVTNLADRYLPGSSAVSGLTFPPSTPLRLGLVAQTINDLHDRVDAAAAALALLQAADYFTQEDADLRYLRLAGGVLTGALTLNRNRVINSLLRGHSEEFSDRGDVSGAVAVNAMTATWQRLRATGNVTFSLSAGSTAGQAVSLMLELVQDASGGRTWTLPASVKRPYGAAPLQFSTAPNAEDHLLLRTRDGGTTWYASLMPEWA